MPNQFGSLEVIAGCMSSGKSEELIRRLKRATIAKQKVLVFKPQIDVRGEQSAIASRDGRMYEAIPINEPLDVLPTGKKIAGWWHLMRLNFLPNRLWQLSDSF